ncbi:YitT family protein [Hymenobacter weizhouensis]|uniref:YitT family protein n=1 Tax=Hymenobacter sp. YIM 151500-1 TaxID=2987689 RepID=UPI0022270FED|nr:YitT family protein [Hymenobacter sp. YIM 151500-1]UYZ64073.1 YitT family protein [Hymenobacter sp. YIM 151500-1]
MLLPQLIIFNHLRQRRMTSTDQPQAAPVGPDEASSLLNRLKNLGLILLGILSAGMGLKGFLLSSHFIDGGATGISMLLANVLRLPLSWGLLIINLPFLLLGYRQMGARFALKSALAIGGLALCLAVVPYPDVTPDLLITAVFGGVFIGAGIGLAMRGGAVLDGTEILALLISKRSALLKVSDVILLLNIVIFGAAAFVLGVTEALYSILTYVAASKTLDFILNGIEQYTGVTIISERNEEIRRVITQQLGRGVTIYKGERGYGKRGEQERDMDIIFTVLTRLELPALRQEVKRVDPKAFIVQHSIDDTVGGMLKKRPFH